MINKNWKLSFFPIYAGDIEIRMASIIAITDEWEFK